MPGKVSLCVYSYDTDLFKKTYFLFSKNLKYFQDTVCQKKKKSVFKIAPATGRAICALYKIQPPLGQEKQYGEHIAAKRSENVGLFFPFV